jgi:transposase
MTSIETATFSHPTTRESAAYIGIDWADRKHDICLYDPATGTWEKSVIAHTPDAIKAWVESLRRRFAGQRIAVAAELKRGPLIYVLCQFDFLVLYPVNPRTGANYRKAFKLSRAKSDPIDAQILVEVLLKHDEKLRAWEPESSEIRALRQWTAARRMLVGEKVRLTNRITAALKNYYPQVLDWFEDKDAHVFCLFVERYSTLKAAQAATPAELTEFFTAHNVVRRSAIERRIEQIAQGSPLTEDAAIVEPSQWLVQALINPLKGLLKTLDEINAKIAVLFAAHADAEFFANLPGAGPQLAPRLLVAFGEHRTRYTQAQDLLRYTGIAPVTESSGNKCWVHWRWSCPIFVRQTFVEWADQSRRHSFWADAFYKMQRKNGKTHPMAMRALAFKWIRILFRCWQDRKPYDEARYLLALKKKKPPLVQNFAF